MALGTEGWPSPATQVYEMVRQAAQRSGLDLRAYRIDLRDYDERISFRCIWSANDPRSDPGWQLMDVSLNFDQVSSETAEELAAEVRKRWDGSPRKGVAATQGVTQPLEDLDKVQGVERWSPGAKR